MFIAGPDTRVVELRVHGVQGTTPQTLVDAVAAVDVAGDGLGRIVRPADRLRRRQASLHSAIASISRTSALLSSSRKRIVWSALSENPARQ